MLAGKVALLAVLFASTGCAAVCPESETSELESGTYQATYRTRGLFGELSDDPKQVVVDRAANAVTITYKKNGKTVVEHYRIKGVHPR